jgi:hypothetical protein
MQQLEGFVSPWREHLFCKFKKALYDLNRCQQFGTRKINQFIKDLDFNHSEFDHNLYFEIGFDGNMVIILLYVDNFLIVVDYKGEIERIRHKLMKAFEMTNLGRIKLYIGVEWVDFLSYTMLKWRGYAKEIL